MGELRDEYLLGYGDILFQRSSETREEVGTANVFLDDLSTATFGGFVIRGRKIGDYSPIFLNKLLKTESARKQVTDKSGGSTRYNVSQGILSSVEVVMPTIPEQEQVVKLLSSIDLKIKSFKKKKALLEKYKKGMMQKIFNREIRFKDEDGKEFGEWGETTLKNVGKFVGGGTPRNSPELWNGSMPWISSSDLNENDVKKVSITRYISDSAISTSATQIVPANSVLIVSRVGVGKIAVNGVDVCTSQDFTSLIPDSYNSFFLAYQLLSRQNDLLSLNQGTSIKGFVKADLEEFKVYIPKLEEQTKIANFLSAIDDKINHVGKQIEKMESWKKGLLGEMFV